MTEVKEKIKANEIIKFLLAVFSLIIITIVSIIINKNQKHALNFITNKYFLISFIGIIIFSYYVMFVLYEDNEADDEKDLKKKRLKIATKHALIAYVIAIFTHIDSIILAPFLLIWIMSYFLDVE
jgi:purine-cytosine permease-like protein